MPNKQQHINQHYHNMEDLKALIKNTLHDEYLNPSLAEYRATQEEMSTVLTNTVFKNIEEKVQNIACGKRSIMLNVISCEEANKILVDALAKHEPEAETKSTITWYLSFLFASPDVQKELKSWEIYDLISQIQKIAIDFYRISQKAHTTFAIYESRFLGTVLISEVEDNPDDSGTLLVARAILDGFQGKYIPDDISSKVFEAIDRIPRLHDEIEDLTPDFDIGELGISMYDLSIAEE